MNGINKYVTETSEEISIESVQLDMSTERRVAKVKPRPKPVVNCFPILCPSMKGDGQTLMHNHSITIVLQCQNSGPEYCDMTRQFFEKMMEL